MNNYYFFVKNHETLGPVSKEQLLTEIGLETLVWYEGLDNWKKASEIPELLEILIPPPPPIQKTIPVIKELGKSDIIIQSGNGNLKIAIIGLLLLFLFAISGYFIFQRYRLTEEMAKETSERFFNMLMMKNLDKNAMKEIYPDFSLIGYRIVLNNNSFIINNLSRNSDDEYEVYASIGSSENRNLPIYLIIGKYNNMPIVKSSKGINYAYYDKVLEYGKRKGCLSGQEDDVLMGLIIEEKRLRQKFELSTEYEMLSLYDNIKSTSSLKKQFGITSGEVTIINDNDIGFGYSDLKCRIEFYDRNGIITNTDDLFISGIDAHSSKSSYASSTSGNSVKFKIIPVIKNTDELKERIRNKVIESTNYGCN